MKPPPLLVRMLEDSLRFSRDHRGAEYKHALPCERCLAMGLAHGIGTYTGQDGLEVFEEYRARINSERPKKSIRITKSRNTEPVKKRVVVRRKK